MTKLTLARDPQIDTENDRTVLTVLEEQGGAVLYWQVDGLARFDLCEPGIAFVQALSRGVIGFDADTDCYTHPRAVARKDSDGDVVGYYIKGN